MPEPIHNHANSSVYDPTAEMSLADDCDPNTATCTAEPAAIPNVVTIEPVVVEGDAGVQALLRRQAEGRCADEKAQAVLTCSLAAFTGTKALLTAATGIAWPLAALDAGATVLGGVNCARTVRVYDACIDEQVERAEHAVECEANGGVPVLGSPAYQPVCLGEKP